MDIRERLEAARDRALADSLPMRRKDGALYTMLAECLSICEMVEAESLHSELRAAVKVSVDVRGVGNAGRGRRFSFAKADVYILVSRFVLQGRDNRNSFYRYAGTLREAHARQIRSDGLLDWLTQNGGVQALYLARPVVNRMGQTKCLRLTEAIPYPLTGVFTITLESTGIGSFNVIKGEGKNDA